MGKHETLKGRAVDHKHFEIDLNPVDTEIARIFLTDGFKQVEVVRPPTRTYNCHGFALAQDHPGWYNVPDFFLGDNYTSVPMESAQPGDVLIYINNGVLAHSAVVIEADGGGIVKVHSKWGAIAEVRHPHLHVPSVYGQPLVLLRPRPGLREHPAVAEAAEKAASNITPAGAAGDGADSAGGGGDAAMMMTTAAAETTGSGVDVPEHVMLMLASTPEVERQIRQAGTSAPASSTQPLGVAPAVGKSESAAAAVFASPAETPATGSTQSDIEKAIVGLSSLATQFGLMLASTPEVLRLAAAELQPVKDLIRIGKIKPEAARAVLEFFERPETQADEQMAGLSLYLLSQLPSKEAVASIARYLEAGRFSSFNGGLAVEALRASVATVSA